MVNNVTLALETHLFFARIMKEHSLFLEAGFPCACTAWVERADWFREQFEELHQDVVALSSGNVREEVLNSQELVTRFTLPAEERTACLSGVAINSEITRQEQRLCAGEAECDDRELQEAVNAINRRALELVSGLIEFKEKILAEVCVGRLFTANYPLLIQHILREAKLYRLTIREIMNNRELTVFNPQYTEEFWNQIMMEHALFIRGLLDPCEEKLIDTADQFAEDYKELLESARRQDCRARQMTEETLAKTLQYRDFKAAGTQGILQCEIASIILPLLADHVLREANHYIRLLERGSEV